MLNFCTELQSVSASGKISSYKIIRLFGVASKLQVTEKFSQLISQKKTQQAQQ